MYRMEPLRRGWNVVKRRPCVSMYLGALTREAGARPLFDVPSHAWPHSSLVNYSVGAEDSWVVEGVVMVEDLPPVSSWDIRAGMATGRVAPNFGV